MSRYGEFSGEMAGGCDRLVHPLTEGSKRLRHRRLVVLLLCTPFLFGSTGVVMVSASPGVTATFTVILTTFSLSWLAALTISATGKAYQIGAVVIASGAIAIAAIVAAAGGLNSPTTLLVVALLWVWRTRNAILLGAIAAGIAVVLQGVFRNLPVAADATVSASGSGCCR